ncbi:MAG: transposase [Gammaproteobacteria bacterium]|nr:MAG: transposase [Gammaproteobacteria bacterium]TND07266.1 MAG: transposase [Gammaproteobacteria bacterium]
MLDTGDDVIAKNMQLIAGRTAQAYNQRKSRKGAFWEDRYHATAVQADEHLARCLLYMDRNMVRAGAVAHPREWPVSSYSELIQPPQRYAITDHAKLMELLGIKRLGDLQHASDHFPVASPVQMKHF